MVKSETGRVFYFRLSSDAGNGEEVRDVVSVLLALCSVAMALLGVAKAYLEYAAAKAKTRTNENGASRKRKPRNRH